LWRADEEKSNLHINATSLGMKPGDALPVPASAVAPGMFVSDIVMAPQPTPLLELASSRGCITQDGTAMLAGQIHQLADFILLSEQADGERSAGHSFAS
jgi:shikimate dehydrogenase